MAATNSTPWYHSNVYTAASACEHCEGIVRHARWCIVVNPLVSYAFAAVLDAGKLTASDHLYLHALGAAWSGKACAGNCNQSPHI
jgi:hypothetical protein